MDGQKAGQALDHHAAHLAQGLADKRDATRALPAVRAAHGAGANPFGAGAGLAGTPAAQHEPGSPGRARCGGGGRQLVIAGPAFPGVREPGDLMGLERAESGPADVIGQAG